MLQKLRTAVDPAFSFEIFLRPGQRRAAMNGRFRRRGGYDLSVILGILTQGLPRFSVPLGRRVVSRSRKNVHPEVAGCIGKTASIFLPLNPSQSFGAAIAHRSWPSSRSRWTKHHRRSLRLMFRPDPSSGESPDGFWRVPRRPSPRFVSYSFRMFYSSCRKGKLDASASFIREAHQPMGDPFLIVSFWPPRARL
jgi:hypothetical protein